MHVGRLTWHHLGQKQLRNIVTCPCWWAVFANGVSLGLVPEAVSCILSAVHLRSLSGDETPTAEFKIVWTGPAWLERSSRHLISGAIQTGPRYGDKAPTAKKKTKCMEGDNHIYQSN